MLWQDEVSVWLVSEEHKWLLYRDILRIRRMSEIDLHKYNECVLQPRLINHELVLVYILYYQ